ncbi:hypothetical protein PS15p_206223 [Mucor circinelloides]
MGHGRTKGKGVGAASSSYCCSFPSVAFKSLPPRPLYSSKALSLAMSTFALTDICPNCNSPCARITKFRHCTVCIQRFHKACYDRRVTINSNDPFICYLCRWGLAAASPAAASPVAAAAFPVVAAASPAATSPAAAPAVVATAAAAPPPRRRKSPPSRSPSPTNPPKLSPVQRYYRFFE